MAARQGGDETWRLNQGDGDEAVFSSSPRHCETTDEGRFQEGNSMEASTSEPLLMQRDCDSGPPADEDIDLSALNGLRGMVAMHIMMHHLCLFSKLGFNLHGSVNMPVFFLLSGFTLVIAYRKTHFGWRPYSERCHQCCKLTWCCCDEIVRASTHR